MAYRIIVSSRTQKEYENAIEYYSLHSKTAPINFIIAIEKTYAKIIQNPLYRIRYKNVRAIKIKQFPYLIYFTVNEKTQIIKVISCFHQKKSC